MIVKWLDFIMTMSGYIRDITLGAVNRKKQQVRVELGTDEYTINMFGYGPDITSITKQLRKLEKLKQKEEYKAKK